MSLFIRNENKVDELIKADPDLKEHNIAYVELLEPLRNAIGREEIYPIDDGHPNKNGYRIIAETIRRYLAENRPELTSSN